MEVEVHQRGGVLGMDVRYRVKEGSIEVIENGLSRGAKQLELAQAERIGALAATAAGAQATPGRAAGISDAMVTAIAIRDDDGTPSQLELRTGDDAPDAVWELISEVSRASDV
jgi:hypothetical protein